VQRTPSGERFPKWVRLRRRSEFLEVYQGGRKCVRRFLVMRALRRPSPDLPTRLGITVTRRTGKAVVRNRLRRFLREAFRRTHGTLAPGWDLVVNLRHEAAAAGYHEVAEDFQECIRRLGLTTNEPQAPAPHTPPSSQPQGSSDAD